MIQTKSQYEDTVIKLMNIIISGGTPSPKSFSDCTEKDYWEILYQCVTDELIIGYSLNRNADGNPTGQCVGTPYVTIKGLSFIDSVEQARALEIANLAKEQAEEAKKHSLSAKLKSNKAYILSVISILVAILTNADKIVNNVEKILSHLNLL